MNVDKAYELIRSTRWDELAKLQIAEHFTYGEALTGTIWRHKDRIKTYCTMGILNHLSETFSRLEEVRIFLGNRPITVTSAFRDPRTNTEVGGASKSFHARGMAVDFNVQGRSPKEVQQALEAWWSGGMGYGKTFTHLDIRPKRTRFNY